MKQKDFVSGIIILLLWAVSASAQKPEALPPPTGGPCYYASYKGSAKIVSIIPRREPTYSEEEYEIRFVFLPEGVIDKKNRLEGTEFFLRICGMYYPGKEFINKYDVKVGKIFPCIAMVEVVGACTPLIFEFPFIEENQKLCPKGVPCPPP
jgi:hypothetical protein